MQLENKYTIFFMVKHNDLITYCINCLINYKTKSKNAQNLLKKQAGGKLHFDELLFWLRYISAMKLEQVFMKHYAPNKCMP